MNSDLGLFDIPELYKPIEKPKAKRIAIRRKKTVETADYVDSVITVQEAKPAVQEQKQEEKIYSVMEFLTHINSFLKPIDATIQGEVGRVNARGSAVYFSLNDTKEKAVVDCIVWRSKLNSMGFDLREGLEVKIIGSPRVYEPMGRLTLEAKYITPVGEGALKLALEKLKQKLKEAGYFDTERKRVLPQFVKKIGLITADKRDAQKDFLTHLGKYGFNIHFHDVRVEGIRAIENVVNAIRWFNENMPELEVLVVTRGGGSLESLQAFNSEEVAKAIFSSKIPVISAVGHENDITIADLVADVRASTPTDAGKILSEPWLKAISLLDSYDKNITSIFRNKCRETEDVINHHEESMLNSFSKHLKSEQTKLGHYESSLTSRMQGMVTRIKNLEENFTHTFGTYFQHLKAIKLEVNEKEIRLHEESLRWYKYLNTILSQQTEQLKYADPETKLKQGYSIVTDRKGRLLKSSEFVHDGDKINVKLYQGSIESTVTNVKPQTYD